ncbi:hypothetical protein HanRHA438_Chr06g0267871 [Helianthus annuus]|nr:hypothetical protein HanRHA438_Chr06g0267871 [Helianthus annuus]
MSLALESKTIMFVIFTGDVDNLWEIEKLRSGLMKTHTIGHGFIMCKGVSIICQSYWT